MKRVITKMLISLAIIIALALRAFKVVSSETAWVIVAALYVIENVGLNFGLIPRNIDVLEEDEQW